MKRAGFLHLLIIALVCGVTATGCKRGPKKMTPIPGSGSQVGGGGLDDGSGIIEPTDVVTDSTGGIQQGVFGADFEANANKDREFFRAQTVYFDFDSSVIKPSEVEKIQVVASHLTANPAHGVRVEGHCDERGTLEYNRALGERRANSVRESLASMGVDPNRVFTVSFGEDVPAVDGHDESAWRMNRRGEFVLLTPQ